jgi:hypothetical protein
MIPLRRGKVFLSAPAPVDGLVLEILFNAPASGATVSIPEVKHNKSKWVCFEMDDASKTLYSVWNSKLKNTYYTDGCGNNIPFGCGVAVNGRDQGDNSEIGTNSNALTYAERLEMLPFGLDVMNHSFYHDPFGNYNNGDNAELNTSMLDDMIFEKMGYKMSCLVVPTNYDGYMTAAAALGYIGGSSTGTFDSFQPYPEWTTQGYINDIASAAYSAIRRDFTDNWTNAGPQWALNNKLFDDGFSFYAIGTHGVYAGADEANFNAWIDDLVSRGGDNLLFTSLREMLEYRYLRGKIALSPSTDGNKLNVAIDSAAVDNNRISWQDLSFVVSGSQTIVSATCTDPSYSISFNPITRLINIKKRKSTW